MSLLSPPTSGGGATMPHSFPESNFKIFSIPISLHRPFLRPRSRFRRLHTSSSPQPPDSQSDSPPPPPPPSPESDGKGTVGSLSGFQDSVRIFLAVLFWMSLFFWSSAWDGRNGGSGGGRLSNKGSRFRR